MNYAALIKEAGVYRGALQTEALISGIRLRAVEKTLRIIAGAMVFLWGGLFLAATFPVLVRAFPAFATYAFEFYPLAKSASSLFLGLWLALFLWQSFFASYYFRDEDAVIPESSWRPPPLRFEVASIAAQGLAEPVLDFFASPFGGRVIARLGIQAEKMMLFLKNRGLPKTSFEMRMPEDGPISLTEFAEALLQYDDELRQFFASCKLDISDVVGAAAWVSATEAKHKEYLRFWGKDSLGRIPGIGKDWAYGEIATVERYAIEISRHASLSESGRSAFGKREAEEIERILSRGREANVLLVGEEGVPALAPLIKLSRRIGAGTVLPPLEHKKIFVFNGVPFLSALKDKASFETEFLKLLSEAARAGNIIFAFENFDKFFQGAQAFGSDILSLLDPFLTSASIQIVAVAELGAFRQVLEPLPKVRERFERVLIEGAGVQGSIPIVEEAALQAEQDEGIFFTYPAIRTIAESAERYFFEGVMPDKALDLLLEAAQAARVLKKPVVSSEDILVLVSKKTGIAVSEAKGEERTKLLKLEEILHERIVGQDEAVRAISGALRRARSGISAHNRPLGSFLFLGPTGVGKTETTKALAEVFFGNENAISRLDMSEYQSADALPRLIGTHESGKPGVLASLLREHPYGVLLLDEFEKTSKEVHDLFLQVLDEGFFTDVSGKRVNARSVLIIATSNAASDIIWNMKHGTPDQDKDIVITEIINRAIFKPELLNRFDGVVLFHPLTGEHLKVIARLMLQKLGKRLKEKGLELVITDSLLQYLVSVGQDPKFGARPMNRAIQEKVEQVIAEKILRGEVSAGSRVELTGADLGLT